MSRSALSRCIKPSVPLKLELKDDNGSSFTREFRLSFDFNAAALVEERTGLNLLSGEVWAKLSARSLSVMLWAAVMAHHPEYRTEDPRGELTNEGLEIIRSYMDIENTDAVHDAVWNAYFISLSKEKREALEKAKKELIKAAGRGGQKEDRPLDERGPDQTGTNSGPSQDTTSASALTSSAA